MTFVAEMLPVGRAPGIEILSFERIQLPRRAHSLPPRMARTFAPPGLDLYERWRSRYDLAIGRYRGIDTRAQSSVEHRINARLDDVIREAPLSELPYDEHLHEYRGEIDLRVPWSWPPLPVVLSVAEASSGMTSLRLSLRSRRRLRYPWRYFHVAHDALTGFEAAVTGAARLG